MENKLLLTKALNFVIMVSRLDDIVESCDITLYYADTENIVRDVYSK